MSDHDRLLSRIAVLLQDGRELTGPHERPATQEAAAELLARFSVAVTETLDTLGERPGARAAAERLTALALRALELDDQLHRRIAADRLRRTVEMEKGLERLRRASNSAELIDRVCRELIGCCSFGRSMLIRIEDDAWLPWIACFPDAPEFEGELSTWMHAQRFRVADLGRELRERRPVLVRDAVAHAGPFEPMVSRSRTASYVAAPVAPTGRLVGVFYADHGVEGRPVEAEDRDLLSTFADQFGRIYERMILIERMRAQRHHVREAFDFAERIMGSLASADIELARGADDRTPAGDEAPRPAAAMAAEFDELLTPREAEVLAMMVRGASNGAIAEQLAIKEGTVKSHVKHILRKLDAVNRAEAVSRYMGRVAA